MSRHFLKPSSIRFLALFLVPAVLLACQNEPPKIKPPQPGSTGGVILVDSPRVFARERLVRDREEQKKWLERQLARTDVDFDVIQGAVETRALQRTSTRVGLDATAAGGLAIRQADASAEDLSRAQEVARLEHEIAVAELEARLEAIRSGEADGNDGIQSIVLPNTAGAAAGGAAPAGGGAASSSSSSTSTPTSGSSSSSGSASSSGSSSAQLPSVSFSDRIVKDRPIDQFRDQLAYREEIRQELLDTGLDDVHDLAGNTLYRFAFDTTVLPGSETGAWAYIKVEPQNTDLLCKKEGQEIDTNELVFLREIAGETAKALKVSFDTNFMALESAYFQEDEVRLLRGDLLIASFVLEDRKQGDQSILKRSQKNLDIPKREQLESDAAKKARQILVQHYQNLLTRTGLGKLVTFFEEGDESGFLPRTLDAGTVQGIVCGLARGLSHQVDTYAVTPRESVERLADSAVSRIEQQNAISAALSAGTIGIEGAFDYLNALENQRQGIRRQPITVGFAKRNNGVSELGWILGPRFRPRYGRSGFDYRHRPAQFPLSAIISLPGWWTSAQFKVTTCWIDSSFGTQKRPTTPCTATKVFKEDNDQSFTVRLPGDPRELVRALVPRARRPFPFFYEPEPRLEIDRKERLVIFGENLWRNPRVFLDTQPADDVEILPDMKGLVATFDRIQAPADLRGNPVHTVQAWVWTSEGESIVGDVFLHKPVKPGATPAPKLAVSITTPSNRIGLDEKNGNRGSIRLDFDFALKRDENGDLKQVVEVLFLKFAGGVISKRMPEACMKKHTVGPWWRVEGNCGVDVTFESLSKDSPVTLLAFQAKGKGDDPKKGVAAKKQLDWIIVKNSP